MSLTFYDSEPSDLSDSDRPDAPDPVQTSTKPRITLRLPSGITTFHGDSSEHKAKKEKKKHKHKEHKEHKAHKEHKEKKHKKHKKKHTRTEESDIDVADDAPDAEQRIEPITLNHYTSGKPVFADSLEPTVVEHQTSFGGKRPYPFPQDDREDGEDDDVNYGQDNEDEGDFDDEDADGGDDENENENDYGYPSAMDQVDSTGVIIRRSEQPSESQEQAGANFNVHIPKRKGRPPKNKAQRSWEPKKKSLRAVCDKLLDMFIKKDAYGFFWHPVDTNIVTDYLQVIKQPMDFGTMRQKLHSKDPQSRYTSMDEFKADFELVIKNAKTYNAPQTPYWKSADKIGEYGLRAIEREAKNVGSAEELSMQERQNSQLGAKSIKKPRSGSISFKFPHGKDEEVDILGLEGGGSAGTPGTTGNATPRDIMSELEARKRDSPTPSRTPIPGMGTLTSVRNKRREEKKKKSGAVFGWIYGSDGSVVGVNGVNDPVSLIPSAPLHGSAPMVAAINPTTLPSVTRSTEEVRTLQERPANYFDYGPMTTMEPDTSTFSALTLQESNFVFHVFGEEPQEAYLRSLHDFAEDIGSGDEMGSKEYQEQRQELLKDIDDSAEKWTRGAWVIVRQVLDLLKGTGKEKAFELLETELGRIHVQEVLEAIQKDPTAADAKSSSNSTEEGMIDKILKDNVTLFRQLTAEQAAKDPSVASNLHDRLMILAKLAAQSSQSTSSDTSSTTGNAPLAPISSPSNITATAAATSSPTLHQQTQQFLNNTSPTMKATSPNPPQPTLISSQQNTDPALTQVYSPQQFAQIQAQLASRPNLNTRQLTTTCPQCGSTQIVGAGQDNRRRCTACGIVL
ncbi:hypothetical protein BZG36_02878 [Bifiguratus adelaidae]|uniref:Bromo domain-containing protein n=1 Tax=Bifiguratus adelaidae TaxID=1938954 RepID=A0A261Y246_9FUNG|nr:hypothetical protein BZG36_02878 [Bifiguratus adelaidae]